MLKAEIKSETMCNFWHFITRKISENIFKLKCRVEDPIVTTIKIVWILLISQNVSEMSLLHFTCDEFSD